MSEKCPNCPVIGQDRECRGQHPWRRRFCELVNPASSAYNPAFVGLLSCPPDAIAPSPDPEPETRRPTAAESLEMVRLMKACHHRTDEAGCGCGGLARCALGKGRDGLVNHADCFACLQAGSVA